MAIGVGGEVSCDFDLGADRGTSDIICGKGELTAKMTDEAIQKQLADLETVSTAAPSDDEFAGMLTEVMSEIDELRPADAAGSASTANEEPTMPKKSIEKALENYKLATGIDATEEQLEKEGTLVKWATKHIDTIGNGAFAKKMKRLVDTNEMGSWVWKGLKDTQKKKQFHVLLRRLREFRLPESHEKYTCRHKKSNDNPR